MLDCHSGVQRCALAGQVDLICPVIRLTRTYQSVDFSLSVTARRLGSLADGSIGSREVSGQTCR
jgi:hypothetical protein